jgi:serine phosphatase RsbU (regulator of sigma subunit)
MNFRFTIGRKIGAGFGVLILSTLMVFLYTKTTLDTSREINERNINVNTPSVDALQELKILVLNSKMLITNWVNVQRSSDDPEKQKLIRLMENGYPKLNKEIAEISKNWSKAEADTLQVVFGQIDTLFNFYEDIKGMLNTFESYEEPTIKMMADYMIGRDGEVDMQAKKVIDNLDALIERQRNNSKLGTDRMIDSFGKLENVVIWLGFALVIGGVLIAMFTVRTIVKPVQQLKRLLLLLGKGIIPEEKISPRQDEIGDMSIALNDLVSGFKRTTEFANQVGSGNFQSEYQPLSEQDTLGHSLLGMRKDLHELTSNLEQKVQERTATIEAQKGEIEVLLTHVTDSIRYAKRIQEAILPPPGFVKSVLPNSFILYKPKDIVSGDFYWIHSKNGKSIFAAVDCTGHGVPGAFMTIIGHNGLNHAINSVSDGKPALILDELNKEVSSTFRQHAQEGTTIKDGMDISICAIDFKTLELEFAAAFNPLWLVRDGAVQEVTGNKFPIGEFIGETQKFTNHKLQLQKGDTIYIFSDGYADQFGGPRGKKFMYRQFKNLILRIQPMDMEKQKKVLNDEIEAWRGNLEQVDDICVIGLRV